MSTASSTFEFSTGANSVNSTTSLDITSADDIIVYLTAKLHGLNRTADEQRNIISNNAPLAVNRDIEDEDWPLKEMTKFGHCLLEEVKLFENRSVPHQQTHVLLDLAEALRVQLDDMFELAAKSKKEIEATEEENSIIRGQISTLKKTVLSRKSKGEMKIDSELEEKSKSAKKEFKKYKQWLNRAVEDLFDREEYSLQELLASLCTAFFSKDVDSYVDLTADEIDSTHVNTLLEASIIMRHPYNKFKVKLCNFK